MGAGGRGFKSLLPDHVGVFALVPVGGDAVRQTRPVTRTLLLALHITGAGAWLGANFVQIALTPRFSRMPGDVAAAWTRETVWLGERYYSLVGAVIAVTGVLLVLDGDWSWSSGFVWVGITVVVIGAVLGVTQFAPLARDRADALDAGDEQRAAGRQSRIMRLAVVDTALVLTAVLAMVEKWQA